MKEEADPRRHRRLANSSPPSSTSWHSALTGLSGTISTRWGPFWHQQPAERPADTLAAVAAAAVAVVVAAATAATFDRPTLNVKGQPDQ